MKKSSTYYFLLQCCFYVCAGWIVSVIHPVMISLHQACIPAGKGPDITQFVATIHAWPYALAGISAVGAILSVVLVDRFKILQHAAFALLFAATVLMLVTAVGYVAPFTHHWVMEDYLMLKHGSAEHFPRIARRNPGRGTRSVTEE